MTTETKRKGEYKKNDLDFYNFGYNYWMVMRHGRICTDWRVEGSTLMDTYITLTILLVLSIYGIYHLLKAFAEHEQLEKQQSFKPLPQYKGKDR